MEWGRPSLAHSSSARCGATGANNRSRVSTDWRKPGVPARPAWRPSATALVSSIKAETTVLNSNCCMSSDTWRMAAWGRRRGAANAAGPGGPGGAGGGGDGGVGAPAQRRQCRRLGRPGCFGGGLQHQVPQAMQPAHDALDVVAAPRAAFGPAISEHQVGAHDVGAVALDLDIGIDDI